MALIQKADLFCEQLNLTIVIRELGIGMIKLFVHSAQLILQGCNNDKECIFAEIIQLFI
jgi:hypothetical protein